MMMMMILAGGRYQSRGLNPLTLICVLLVCLLQVNLAHCVTYLSRASKSNESYVALSNARDAVRQHRGPQPAVPLHLRNATTNLAHRMGLSFSCCIVVFSADCCVYETVVSNGLYIMQSSPVQFGPALATDQVIV